MQEQWTCPFIHGQPALPRRSQAWRGALMGDLVVMDGTTAYEVISTEAKIGYGTC